MVKQVMLFFVLACLAGCGGKKTNSVQSCSQAALYYEEQELKQKHLDGSGITVRHQKEIDVDAVSIERINYDYIWTIDIPVPIDAVEKRNYCCATSDVYTIGYTAPEKLEELIPFYKQQMELLGWQCGWETEGLEALLMFEKPHKHCAVSIRPSNSRKKTDIIIMQKTV